MARLAVSGKNISFDEPKLRHSGSGQSSPARYEVDEAFQEALNTLTRDELDLAIFQVTPTSTEPAVLFAMFRRSIMDAAASKNASLGSSKVSSPSHAQSSQFVEGTMREQDASHKRDSVLTNAELRYRQPAE